MAVPATIAHTAAQAAAEPTLLGFSAEGWVYVGITIFLLLALTVFKFPKLVTQALDKRIADTRRTLDEAAALRAEAEAMLAEAKRRQSEAHKDAEGIIAHARVEAEQLVDKAKADADLLIKRRGKMAEGKIAAAERAAIAEVRAKAASTAAAAAAMLITQRHDAKADKALIDQTISALN
jgi:F-type H+-transporting ATPase subunit b